jgi:type II secretion system protein J
MKIRKAGFTLVELVIAVAITALLMGAIMGILVNVLSSAERSEEMNSTQKIGHAIVNIVQRDLESTLLPEGAKSPSNQKEYFRVIDGGDQDTMDFITVVPSRPDEENKRGPISEVGYRVVSNQTYEEQDLFIIFRREDMWTDDEQPMAGGKFTEIFDRLLKFNVTCYDGTEWRDSWDWVAMGRIMPMAVKIEIQLAVDKKRASSALTPEEIDRLQRESSFTTIITLPLGEKYDAEKAAGGTGGGGR